MLRGILQPVTEPGSVDASGYYRQVWLELSSVQILKGALPKSTDRVWLQHFSKIEKFPSAPFRELQGFYGKNVVVFAQRRENAKTDHLVEAREISDTIVSVEPEMTKQIQAEIRNQEAIAACFATSSLSRRDKWDQIVEKNLDLLLQSGSTQGPSETQKHMQQVINQMEAMGPGIVPALVRHMDDRRDLPGLLLGFRNPPGSWEADYYSSPLKIADVIDSLLYVLTRASVTQSIGSGGTDTERDRAVRAWRIYLFYAKSVFAAPIAKGGAGKFDRRDQM